MDSVIYLPQSVKMTIFKLEKTPSFPFVLHLRHQFLKVKKHLRIY